MSEGGTHFVTLLRELAAAEPDRVAVTCADLSVTRQELVDRVERLARRFDELGVQQGSFVTLSLPNSLELVDALFAAWLVGAVPQPISHRLPPAERRDIVDLADPALAIGVPPEEAGGRPTMTQNEVRGIATDRSVPTSPPFAELVAPVWKAVTSGGSTGRPKLIVATQPAEAAYVMPFGDLLAFPHNGSVLVTGPMSHNAPLVTTVVGLIRGNHVVVMPKFDASETLRLVEEHRTQWLYLVPTMMQRIWRLPEEERLAADMSSVEVAFHMAAPCPPWLKKAWIDWLGPKVIYELYGGTELQAMTVVVGDEWLTHPGTVGRVYIGEIEVRDENDKPLPAGDVGELWMRRGPDQADPYRYVGATAKRADDGWESLGDMGSMDAEGFVYLADRQTDMILVGGSNVYPAEIEAALDEHPAVRSSCVIGLPHEDLGNVPHAIVDLISDATDDDLLAHLRERLAPYKIPRTIERVAEPIRDDAGKVRRSALRAARVPSA